MVDVSVIILTFNESIHIRRCLESVQAVAKKVFVVDSFSQDDTIQIAEKFGATIFQNPFLNQAQQFNWALDNLPIESKWILRLDADEYISENLSREIIEKIPQLTTDISGVILPFKRVFLGKEIKRGTGGIKMLRLFRYKKAMSDQRWMDEHIQLMEGRAIEFEHEFSDDNLNNLSWWTQKHNGYAFREAISLLDLEFGILGNSKYHENSFKMSDQAASKRRKKLKYAKQPLFWRSFAYFIYRYIFKLGFLEGKEGFLWHFFQGWWYRTLVDAKIFEIKKACGNDPEKIKAYIFKNYQIKL
jgi:glycosyltransferase involved in cell wall biosynthesis